MAPKIKNKRQPIEFFWPWEGKIDQLMSCEICGVLVTDTQRHIEFHRKVFVR